LSPEALAKNQAMEYERNKERFQFLKWGAQAFKNLLIVPPGLLFLLNKRLNE
jgi:aconitate hydratase